jgi:hypothetical protein
MAQLTYDELKNICPRQMHFALIKLNSIISSLTTLTIHFDTSIYDIVVEHKDEANNLSSALKDLLVKKPAMI